MCVCVRGRRRDGEKVGFSSRRRDAVLFYSTLSLDAAGFSLVLAVMLCSKAFLLCFWAQA